MVKVRITVLCFCAICHSVILQTFLSTVSHEFEILDCAIKFRKFGHPSGFPCVAKSERAIIQLLPPFLSLSPLCFHRRARSVTASTNHLAIYLLRQLHKRACRCAAQNWLTPHRMLLGRCERVHRQTQQSRSRRRPARTAPAARS